MKKMVVASVIGGAMLLSVSAGVYAGANLQEIKAYLNNDIKVKVHGKQVQLLDENGSVVTPITFKGTTYLPARAIANSLNVAVGYEAATSTVLFGEKVDGTPINAKQVFFSSTKDPNMTQYKNKDYIEVLKNMGGSGSNFTLEPEKKFQTLYLQVAAIGADVKIRIKDNNSRLLKEETVTINDGLKTIEATIGGLSEVTVFYSIDNFNDDTGIFVPLTTSYYK